MAGSEGEIDFDFGLAGRVAVVTGGASGIGQAIATLFVKKGAKVAIVDRDGDAAASQAAALGPSCKAFVCDVADVAAIDAMAADVTAALGDIDILVNSAGVIHLAAAETLTAEAWDQTFEVNLRGVFLVSQAVGRMMIAHGGGKIINLASQAGSVAIEQHVAYCAAKFGVIGLSKVLALEWGQYGITVNTLSPTVVLTELGRKAWAGPKGEAMKKLIPSGRFAQPEEIAAAALFMASNGADMINGADLLIDGGYTTR